MKIERIVVGLYEENCYLIIKDDKCIIVDPGDEKEKIISKIEKLKLNVIGVLITHAHFDHVGALNAILDRYNVPIYYHNVNNEIEYNKLIDVKEEKYIFDDFKFEIIFTPGHRSDSVTYYFYEENIMFTGDFLFRGTIGRTDLEYASINEMKKSIEKIKDYSDDIVIYPGHGDLSNLKFEKEYNMFFKDIIC